MNGNKSASETRMKKRLRWLWRWRKKQVILQVWMGAAGRWGGVEEGVIRSRKQVCNSSHSRHDDRRAKKPEKKDENNERN